jgi:hypothetical protein
MSPEIEPRADLCLGILGPEDELGSLEDAVNVAHLPSTVEVRLLDDDALDALQDRVYSEAVSMILMRSVETLPCDEVSAELILSGWRKRGIQVCLAEEERARAGAIKAALEEIDDYGKIPWVP